MDFATALSIAKDSRGSNETAYREAVEYLIDHRAELKSRVFVLIPGGMTSNTDPTWDKVRQNTASRCGCGNERTLLPLHVREKYEPGETLKVGYKAQIHVRPKGSDKESCVVRLEIVCFQDKPEETPPADAPAADAPAAEAPVTEAPAAEAPTTETPTSETPTDGSATPTDPSPFAAPAPRTYGLRLINDPFGPVGLNAFLDLLAPKAYKLDVMAAHLPEGGLHLMFVEENRKLPVLNIAGIDPTKPEVTLVLDADMEVFDPSLEPNRHFVQMAVMTIGGPSSDETSPATETPATEPPTAETPEPAASPAE